MKSEAMNDSVTRNNSESRFHAELHSYSLAVTIRLLPYSSLFIIKAQLSPSSSINPQMLEKVFPNFKFKYLILQAQECT